jgi:hypothetical protein
VVDGCDGLPACHASSRCGRRMMGLARVISRSVE